MKDVQEHSTVFLQPFLFPAKFAMHAANCHARIIGALSKPAIKEACYINTIHSTIVYSFSKPNTSVL